MIFLDYTFQWIQTFFFMVSEGMNLLNSKESQDMRCFLKPSWGDRGKELSQWD